jgi:hypothetical protein
VPDAPAPSRGVSFWCARARTRAKRLSRSLSLNPSSIQKQKSQQPRSPLTPDDDDDADAPAFVEERITLFTADGIVTLPGRRVPAASPHHNHHPHSRRHRRRPRLPPPPPHATLPPTWDAPDDDLLAWAWELQGGGEASEADGPSSSSSSSLPSFAEGGLCVAAPFVCRAASSSSAGSRRVALHGFTRCPSSLSDTVGAVAAALRGAVLAEAPLPRPPGGLAAGTAITVALPLLHGVPPALDALVAAIATAPDGSHVIERVVKEWVVLPGGRW